MEAHLPVLPIVVPLIAAPLAVLLRRRRLVIGFSIVVCWVVFLLASLLLGRVLEHGIQTYQLGGWAAPWGIEYRIDALSAFVVFFVSALGAIVLTYAPRSIAKEIPPERQTLFCVAYLLCVTGLLGIAITGDLFNLFVFLEISALSSYALISQGGRRSLTAALQYLVMGTVGATFILIGIGLLYQMTGTLNMADMAARLAEVKGVRTVRVATGFLAVGIMLKMALFPLHAWLPNAYTHAPSVVTAFLAATATKVSVYILLRFAFSIFHVSTSVAIFMPIALIAIFATSISAIFQTNLKRLLAYSSLAQIGYMVLGVSFASVTGLTGAVVHLFNHALTKGGMFLALGCIALRVGSLELKDLAGIGKRMPVTMFLWVLGGLGLIGVPATAGFISKWYLIQAALERGWWPVAVAALLSSLLAVIYVWRVVEIAYFRKPPEGAPVIKEAPLSMLLPTAAMIFVTIYFGLQTSLSADVARTAAESLLGVTR